VAVPWDVVASGGGAVVATVLGVVAGGVVTRRAQDRHWLRDTQAATYAAVLREYARIEIDLRTAYHQNRLPAVDWAPWGAALASLSLVASTEAAAITARFTEAIMEFERFVLGGKPAATAPERDAELRRVSQLVAEAQMAFVNAARQSLDRSQRPLRWQLGGPPTR
jgi:hypothetical protein